MQVPLLTAPGLTLGAALSNSTRERPCASLPVTTRRIGLIGSGMSVLVDLKGRSYSDVSPRTKEKCMLAFGWVRRLGRMAALAAIGASLALPNAARAQDFPSRPGRIIVGA